MVDYDLQVNIKADEKIQVVRQHLENKQNILLKQRELPIEMFKK